MNNTNPFQGQNPFGAAQTSSTSSALVANTLNTTLSAFGLGRQAVASNTSALQFRPAV